MKKILVLVVAVLVIWGAFLITGDSKPESVQQPEDTNGPADNSPGENDPLGGKLFEVAASNLNVPWEIAFLPNGGMLVTERPGTLLKIEENKQTIPIDGVHHIGEGGLLGLALHPDFENNNYLYLYLTTQTTGGLENRVERYTLSGNALTNRKVIIEEIPGARFHDGGRMAFGPDGLLYITTGDAQNEDSAQDTKSLAGKILRIRDDGSIPSDNPFGNAVYSYGHRNPQGIAWDSEGRLWQTEHGRSGVLSGFDEVNRIEKGGNYGWPEIQGGETRGGMISPYLHSGASDTWAPAGGAIVGNSLFFTGLRGEALYELPLGTNNPAEALKTHFEGEFGRLRAVVLGPDGLLYISTSNTDGRGSARNGDDKIIRVNPQAL